MTASMLEETAVSELSQVDACEFQDTTHADAILKVLNRQRNVGIFTDVVLCVGDDQFPCHKAVLSSNAYFEAMFSMDLKEQLEGKVCLEGVEKETMKLLLDFFYTGEILIHHENVQALLEASCMFQHTKITNVCCQFLEGNLDASNCLGIWYLAEALGCTGLYEAAKTCALQRFEDVARGEEIVEIPIHQLQEYLGHDSLKTRNEELVFETLMRWMKSHEEESKCEIKNLLSLVRLPFLQYSYLVNTVQTNPFVRQSEECIQMTEKAKSYWSPMFGTVKDPIKPRRCSKQVIIVVGGRKRETTGWKPVPDVRCYDPSIKREAVRTRESFLWANRTAVETNSSTSFVSHCTLSTLPSSVQMMSVVVHEHHIYVTGGKIKRKSLSQVLRYNLFASRWETLASMQQPRRAHGSGVVDGLVYVLGGRAGPIIVDKVECYHPIKNEWQWCAPLPQAVRVPSVASLRGKLYAICGSQGAHRPCPYIQVYTPSTDSWSLVSTPGLDHIAAPAVVLDDSIYILGGELSKQVTVFKPKDGSIATAPDLNFKRADHAAAQIDSKIYVLGGMQDPRLMGAVAHDSIHCYSTVGDRSECWDDVGKMPEAIAMHGAVAVYKDYLRDGSVNGGSTLYENEDG
ncbi:KLHL29 [Branchiostoma lanceolatum]|uniref:KLHL29 protein n=2 Tax=Branchiostoma lanceolatum TaxID=7740 RepID=A0A8J9VF50_BRALA|nr:KLHL29 [Branchiostoma lanceolatum]